MTEETTTEQLAEIDRDMADIERQVAELEQQAAKADYKTQELPTKTQEPEDKTQEPPQYTPPEGWRLVRFGELLLPGDEIVQIDDGRRYPTHRIGDAVGPNQQYIRRIKPEPQAESHTEQQIEELRSEVSYVQNLLGTERRRVTTLEELVTSLRTINEAQEKAVDAAGKENTDLQHRLNVVAAEWAEQAETSRRLQIELDAAQQVPADSPELRQLRSDLAEVTRERDQYRDVYDRVIADLQTVRETTTADTVEAIVEWLQAFRGCNSPALALLLLEALPSIMRTIVGLNADEEIE